MCVGGEHDAPSFSRSSNRKSGSSHSSDSYLTNHPRVLITIVPLSIIRFHNVVDVHVVAVIVIVIVVVVVLVITTVVVIVIAIVIEHNVSVSISLS